MRNLTGLLRMILRLLGDARAIRRGRGAERLMRRGARRAMRQSMRGQSTGRQNRRPPSQRD